MLATQPPVELSSKSASQAERGSGGGFSLLRPLRSNYDPTKPQQVCDPGACTHVHCSRVRLSRILHMRRSRRATAALDCYRLDA